MILNHCILLVDNDPHMIWLVKELFSNELHVLAAAKEQEAIDLLVTKKPDLILLDIKLYEENWLDLLYRLREVSLTTPIIIITACPSVQTAVTAMAHGVFDYITKPFDPEEFRQKVFKVLETKMPFKSKSIQNKLLENKIIAESKEMLKIWQLVQKVAPTDASVLITGESGTGKEVIARAVHNESLRANKPFIPVNCAAIPNNLLESEIFGFETGAFTGAHKSKPGKFELAHEGTILLDEIGDMDILTQAKILRVIEEMVVERLGSTKRTSIDVRIISSTNKDLQAMVKSGEFREDLYYRLAVFPIVIPPLKKRLEDISVLARYFLKHFVEKYHRFDIIDFHPTIIDVLCDYDWPGNVRELRNLVEKLVIISEGPLIMLEELPSTYLSNIAENAKNKEEDIENITKTLDIDLPCTLKEGRNMVERQIIINSLRKCDGNRTQAAQLLGITRRSLQLKIKEFDIDEF